MGLACTRGMPGRAQGTVEVAKASGTGRSLRQGAEHQQGEQRGNNKRAAASSRMEQEQRQEEPRAARQPAAGTGARPRAAGHGHGGRARAGTTCNISSRAAAARARTGARAPAMAAERGDDNDEHGGQRMQIRGRQRGKARRLTSLTGRRSGRRGMQ